MPVLLFAGEEDFLLARKVSELKVQLVDPAFAAFNFVKLQSPGLQEVVDIAGSLPFGPGKKMILIDRCELFHKKRATSEGTAKASAGQASAPEQKNLLEEFDRALSSVAEQTYVVFACPYNFDRTLKTSKVIEKHAQVEEFPKQKYFSGGRNGQLETWCRKEAHLYGATIDDDAIGFLLDSTEANLRQVSKEIEKAATYVLPQKRISLDVVSQLSSHHSHIFALIDHWAEGNSNLAISSLNELLSRQSGIPLIATLHTTLSRWIELKAAAEKIISKLPAGAGQARRELPFAELAKKIAWETKSQPFLIEKDLRRIKSLSLAWLVQKRINLCQLEYYVKTGQMSDSHALALLIAS